METSTARREGTVLVVLVFFLGALLGAAGNHLWGQRVWGMQPPPVTREQVMSDLARELTLTPPQQKQLSAIMDDTRSQWRAIYTPYNEQRERIRQQSREHIREMLTPEQQPKFDDFMRHIDEQRKKDTASH